MFEKGLTISWVFEKDRWACNFLKRVTKIAIVLGLAITFFTSGAIPAVAWDSYTGSKDTSPPSSHHITIADQTGDTYGTGAVQHDITSFSAYYTAAELIVSITFAGTISPSDSGQPDAVVGFIDFDTDQNPTTGTISSVDVFSPYTTGLGVDYFVNLNYNSSTGDIPVFHTLTEVGRAPVSFTSDSFTVRIPLALIGGDDGIVDTATVLGTIPEPTDACPNGGYITSSPQAPTAVPTLAQWGMIILSLLLAGAAILVLRRRRLHTA